MKLQEIIHKFRDGERWSPLGFYEHYSRVVKKQRVVICIWMYCDWSHSYLNKYISFCKQKTKVTQKSKAQPTNDTDKQK